MLTWLDQATSCRRTATTSLDLKLRYRDRK